MVSNSAKHEIYLDEKNEKVLVKKYGVNTRRLHCVNWTCKRRSENVRYGLWMSHIRSLYVPFPGVLDVKFYEKMCYNPVDTGHKLNVHKTSKTYYVSSIYVLCLRGNGLIGLKKQLWNVKRKHENHELHKKSRITLRFRGCLHEISFRVTQNEFFSIRCLVNFL